MPQTAHMKTSKRTARRVLEVARTPVLPLPSTPAVAAAAPAAPNAPAALKAGDDDTPQKVRKLALIFNDDESSFNIDRMERSTIDRFRRAAKNTPGLLDNGDGAADPDGLSLDVSGLISKGYELLFGSAAALAVRARKLSPKQATAFVNPERIQKLVPRTERALEDKFGDRVRNLPPLAQLSIDIVATLGLMLQDAAQMPEDEPADGAPRFAPGQPVPGPRGLEH